jgi:hypothetical protein
MASEFLNRILANAEKAREQGMLAATITELRQAEEREAGFLKLAATLILSQKRGRHATHLS